MGKNIEIESKALLSEQEYKKLLPLFNVGKHLQQTNYYFDTKHFEIIGKKAGLRIRKESDYFELTIKLKSQNGKIEVNQEISAKQADLFKNCGVFPSGEVYDEVVKLLENPQPEIICFGTLENERFELEENGDLLCLDMSKYCGLTDYEIEIESNSMEDAITHMKNLLKNNDIEYKENRIHKIQRLLNAVIK